MTVHNSNDTLYLLALTKGEFRKRMKIIQILNNSSAIVSSEEGELIILGKGVAFGKKIGETINENKIERKYLAENIVTSSKFQALIDKIPLKDFELSFDIIARFKLAVPYKLNDIIYISLTDHISFAIQRAKEGIMIPNAVLNEIQIFYPFEFTLGAWAVEYIFEEVGIELTEHEAGFIALHIINAKRQEDETGLERDSMKIVNDLVSIIENFYGITFEKDNVNFHRLVTHLKYFILREFSMGSSEIEEIELFQSIIQKFPEAYAVIENIDQYFQTFYKKKLPQSEKAFLTIHINRVLHH